MGRAVLVLVFAMSSAHADVAAYDVTAIRDGFRAFGDGKGHVVTMAFGPRVKQEGVRAFTFYGDGKTMYDVPTFTSDFLKTKWEPDDTVVDAAWPFTSGITAGAFHLVKDHLEVTCGKRTATLAQLDRAEAAKLVAKAAFKHKRFDRSSILLARDDSTTYYFVDLPTVPNNSVDYHLYTGKRGAMKQVVIKDLAADSAGVVIVTAAGTLRMTPGKERYQWNATWATPKQSSAQAAPLVEVPLNAETQQLIYGDLGVYTGLKFGTPCDDL